MSILIVDDNADVRETVKDVLVSHFPDEQVFLAENGKDALLVLNKRPISLVLLDVMMPIMNGWQTAAAIREHEQFHDVPIIFLTAKSDPVSKSVGCLTGMCYIAKPFDNASLCSEVAKILRGE